MIRLTDISLPFDHAPEELTRRIGERLGLPPAEILRVAILRKAIDARRKNAILAVYTLDVSVPDESAVLSKCAADKNISPAPALQYIPPAGSPRALPPVIVGSGPCGLLAALLLARLGAKPILIERGKPVTERVRDVNAFWQNGTLNPESNALFGEGGAGTFSDGKLTSQIKDKSHRTRNVLEEFVLAGAPEEILWHAKPHIGTDNLITVVKNIRQTILSLGGQVRFETKLTGIQTRNGQVSAALVNEGESIETSALVLALGHSARDTFEMLPRMNLPLAAKPFSLGVRIEHPQSLIDRAQYGKFASHPALGPADYKLVHHTASGRSAYTFCMCPGGQVIACSSEPGAVVTNGMSFYSRNRPGANSALLAEVTPRDFESDSPLAGIDFQRKWEQKAFQLAGQNYFAPVQLARDFLAGRPSRAPGRVLPSYTPGTTFCDLAECLPAFVIDALREAIPQMDKKLKGFALPDAVLTAVESRSSSPLRILRDESFQSPALPGLYPAGEGAGYAGGIISSAVDGLKVAEAIWSRSP